MVSSFDVVSVGGDGILVERVASFMGPACDGGAR